MKSTLFILSVLLAVASVPAVKLGACGPENGMVMMFLQYDVPSFSPVAEKCDTCKVYFDREFSVVAIGDSLKGTKLLPSLGAEKLVSPFVNWFEFKTDKPVTVYLVASTDPIDVLGAQGCVRAWLNPGGWTQVSKSVDAWSVTWGGEWYGEYEANKNDNVWRKTGTEFALGGQGNVENPTTGGAGRPTYLILIDTGTDPLEMDTSAAGEVCASGIKLVNGIASSFSSMALYPNPFNSKLNISFAGILGNVRAQVFDLEGSIVKTLSVTGNGAVWDGRDNSGLEVNSGTYLVRMSSGNKVYSDKVIINR